MKAHSSIRVMILLALIFAVATMLHGQTKPQKLKTSTERSDKYGEGGSVKTTTDETFVVTEQVWKDKNGKVREVYIFHPKSDEGRPLQQWSFYTADDQEFGHYKILISYEPSTRTFTTGRYKELRDQSYNNVDGSKALEWVEKVGTEFAKDGTIPEPWKDTKTAVEQPGMPPTEVFHKPNETKPQTKPEKVATGLHSTGVLDPCLVGSWVSKTTTKIDGAVGAANINMTIERDRSITIVYDGMEPRKYGTGESQSTHTWAGRAKGHISAGKGVIIQQSVADSNDLTASVTQRGQTTTRKNNQLGMVIMPAPAVNLYQCDEKTLTIQITLSGIAVDEFTFVKQ